MVSEDPRPRGQISGPHGEEIGFARDLMRMKHKPYGRNHERWTVIVTDEKGLKVITVPFSEAMPGAKQLPRN